MTQAVLLDIKNLSVGFRGGQDQCVSILRNIHLTVHAGETIGIVGESGSGKSSLAFAAMAYFKSGLEAQSGQVVFNGQDMLQEIMEVCIKQQMEVKAGKKLKIAVPF